jgi:hypothetical protein
MKESEEKYRINYSAEFPIIELINHNGPKIKRIDVHPDYTIIYTNHTQSKATNGDPRIYRTLSSLSDDELVELSRKGFPLIELEELRSIEARCRQSII